MRISIVINGDTRPGVLDESSNMTGSMVAGTRSIDFLKEGVDNKLKFFQGYDVETILYIDVHEPLGKEDLWEVSQKVDNLILHKHVNYFEGRDYFTFHLDLNLLEAMIMARGDYIFHFDWDTMAFKIEGSNIIDKWISLLDEGTYDYISYPSKWSPRAVNDKSFTYDWASTRSLLFKRGLLDYTETIKCFQNSQYLYDNYLPGDCSRKCGWLEHVFGMMAGKGRVFYPPIDDNDHMIFSWSKYVKGVLGTLNGMPYSGVVNYVYQCGGIHYPCDVAGRQL